MKFEYELINKEKVTQAVEAFEKFSKASDRWNTLFSELSEEEEAELEHRLLLQGVTVGRSK